MEPAKTKKLEDYAAILEKQAQSVESQGNFSEAAKLYVKLIDIFLLLARESQDHPTWVKYATRAETLQKKTKELIASSNDDSQKGKASTIKKILGIKTGEEKAIGVNSGTSLPEKGPQSQVASPHIEISQTQEEMVPKRLYDQVLEKSKQLESSVASMVDRSEHENLKTQCIELSARLASLPSKSSFDELTQRLSNSIPRVQYEDLQRAFVNLVPKETYNTAQARIAELEAQLENSIPRSILDNLANEISFLIVTASIPISPQGEVESVSIITQPVSRDHVAVPATKSDQIQDELLTMKQKIDMLELKMKSYHLETVKV